MRCYATIVAAIFACVIAGPLVAAPELVLQTGHVGAVDHLQYSPDGKLVASGSADGTVKIWNASTGTLLSTLPMHHGAIQGIDFIKNGAEIAVVAADGWASRWDPLNSSLIASSTGPVDHPESSAITFRDGKVLVASSGADHSIKLWNIPDAGKGTGKVDQLASLDGHTETVTAMAFSSDGAYLASGSVKGEDRFWDVDDESPIRFVRDHAMPIRSLAFSGDGKWCVDASDDGVSDVWNVQSGGTPKELQMNAPGDGIGAVAFSADGSTVVTGGHPSTDDSHEFADLWTVGVSALKMRLMGKIGVVTAVALSPDGQSIATGGRDHTIRLWRVGTTSTTTASRVLGGTDATPTFALAKNGSVIVAGGADGVVRFWSARSGEMLRSLPSKPGTTGAVAVLSTDGPESDSPYPGGERGGLLLTGGVDNAVTVRDFDTGALVKSLKAPGRVNSIAVSPDGSMVAAGCGSEQADGSVRVWDAKTWAEVTTLDGPSEMSEVRSVVFSVDGKSLASAGGINAGPGQVYVWDLATKKQNVLDYQDEYPTCVRDVAYTPDGRRLIAAGGTDDENNDDVPTGSQAIVWNAKTLTAQREINAAQDGDGLDSVAVSADGTEMAAGDHFGVIRIWNPKSGEFISTLSGGHFGPVLHVAFSPDGGSIITSGADSSIRIWDTATGRLRGTLIPFKDQDDWLAVTPDGYYDGSGGASRQIRWQLGSASYPVEAFSAALHQPDEVAKSLSGIAVTPPPADDQIGSLTNPPPSITFVSPHDGAQVDADSVDVTVQVASWKPVQSVLLFSNGRPIAQGGKPLELGAKPLELGAKPLELGAKPLELGAKALELGAKDLTLSEGETPPTVSQYGVTLPFKPGDSSVVISAVAYDDAMRQGQQEVRISRSGQAALGKLYVLAVGVTKYANPHFNLKYAAADAGAFADLWKAHAASLYTGIDVTELLDDQATVTNVRAALFNLLDKAGDQDTVILFLSGHGLVLDDGSYYFATHEIDPSTADTVAATALPWTSFQLALSRLKARHVLMFLDACHSGSALGNHQARAERMAEALAAGSGVIVFSSSRGSEYSYELDSLGHGAFTQALIEALGQGKANFSVDGSHASNISAEEVLAYLRIRVPQLTNNQQTPSCPLLQDYGDPFPLVSE